MRKIINIIFTLTIGVLIFFNVYLFCSSLKLSDEINNYEVRTSSLHKENLVLEKKVSDLSSLKFAESMAPYLGFTQKSQPTYLEKLDVALKY